MRNAQLRLLAVAFTGVFFFLTLPSVAQTPGNLSESQWAEMLRKSPLVSISSIVKDPENFKGRLVQIQGEIAPGLASLEGKQFTLIDKDKDGVLRVEFSLWYSNASQNVEGRSKIRDLVRSWDVFALSNKTIAAIGVVSLFSDNFEPFLGLIDHRQVSLKDTSQAQPQLNSREDVYSQNSKPNIYPDATNSKLVALIAGQSDSKHFKERAESIDASYEETWDAILKVFEKEKIKVLQSDKEKGTIMTDVARQGIIGFPSYNKYALAIERDTESKTKLFMKAFRYSDGIQNPDGTVQWKPSDYEVLLDKKDARFIADIRKALTRKK